MKIIESSTKVLLFIILTILASPFLFWVVAIGILTDFNGECVWLIWFLTALSYIIIIFIIYKSINNAEIEEIEQKDQYKVIEIEQQDQYRKLNDYFVYKFTYIHIESGKKTTKIIVHEHPLWEYLFDEILVVGSTF